MEIPKSVLVFMSEFLLNIEKNSENDPKAAEQTINVGCELTRKASNYLTSLVDEVQDMDDQELVDSLNFNVDDFIESLDLLPDNIIDSHEFIVGASEETGSPIWQEDEDSDKLQMLFFFIAPMLRSSHFMMLLLKACWKHGQETGKPFLPQNFHR